MKGDDVGELGAFFTTDVEDEGGVGGSGEATLVGEAISSKFSEEHEAAFD